MNFNPGEPYLDGIGGLGVVENQFDSLIIIGNNIFDYLIIIGTKPSVAVYVINGIAVLILLVTWWLKNTRYNLVVKPKYSYGWLLFSLIIAFILLIVNEALANANVIGIVGSTHISSAITGVRGLARLLLLVIVCYITPHVFDRAHGYSNIAFIAKVVNAAFYVVLVALWITALALTYVAAYADENASLKVVKSAHKVSAAYYVMYFIAGVIASGFLSWAIKPAWINLNCWTRTWLVFTILMFLIYNVANMVAVFGSAFKDKYPSEGSVVVFMVFDSIVTSLTVFGILISVDRTK
ncbi:uncharacterized protein K441DRAFT_662421 [Cenococcum geophilum 1.58]|uniref:uncharacterized protein n=1 Tax=Cenococcum geophilum 1.58 TaxID=794803 RepID=UPI00358F6136|nr:hypothetical protein K441DRAFT_662421 [Cenococcum geophilum 1.58]